MTTAIVEEERKKKRSEDAANQELLAKDKSMIEVRNRMKPILMQIELSRMQIADLLKEIQVSISEATNAPSVKTDGGAGPMQ